MPDKPAAPMGMPGMLPGQMPGMMPQQNPMMMMMQMMQMMMQGGMGGAEPAGRSRVAPVRVGAGSPTTTTAASTPTSSAPRPSPSSSARRSACRRAPCSTTSASPRTARRRSAAIPKGCTIALAGPPGKGKTRTALTSLLAHRARRDEGRAHRRRGGLPRRHEVGTRRPLLAPHQDRDAGHRPRRGRRSASRCSRTST